MHIHYLLVRELLSPKGFLSFIFMTIQIIKNFVRTIRIHSFITIRVILNFFKRILSFITTIQLVMNFFKRVLTIIYIIYLFFQAVSTSVILSISCHIFNLGFTAGRGIFFSSPSHKYLNLSPLTSFFHISHTCSVFTRSKYLM